jgi:hypothetical protein
MHTFELQRSIKLFFAQFEMFDPFKTALSELAKSALTMESHLPGLARGGDRLNHNASQIHNYFSQVRQTTAKINQRQFFKALEHFHGAISQLKPTHIPVSTLISSLDAEVEEFAILYDAFLSHQSGENALPLLLAAKLLNAKIETLFNTLQLIESIIGEEYVPSNSESAFSLFLPENLDLLAFSRKLLAIQAIYSELCMLLSVSENTHPLRISKIESGSLWVKLFGEPRAVGMMISFVENTASWIFRSYTTEGKLASVPKKVEAIESVLRLSDMLTKAGIDSSAMKEHIEKSAVAVSKGLAEILEGQSSVTVNEHTISLSSEISKGLLGGSAPLQLLNFDQTASDKPPAAPRLR